jgi:protein Mpv17
MLTKVAIDQLVFAPAFIGIFYTAQGALEGKSWSEITEKLNKVLFYSNAKGIHSHTHQ